MTRKRPKDRLPRLVDVATEAFIAAKGYHRTQMDDVARGLGVSKGTLYLYVESKEALFDLCVRHADRPDSMGEPNQLPVPTPVAGATLQYVQERLATDPRMAQLTALACVDESESPTADFEALLRLLFQTLADNRRTIKLVDVAAIDHPELSGVWFSQTRGGLLALLQPYLERRVAQGAFLPVLDGAMAARYAIETCVWWAVHRHWDPAPQDLDESHVEDGVVQLLLRAFIGAR
jgi:AcrR family transcriptional regulator